METAARTSRPMGGMNFAFIHPLALIVVITDAEVFLKVLLCVFEIVLRLCRDHGEHSVTAVGQRSVSATQTLIDPALGATLAAVLVEKNQSPACGPSGV